MKDLTELFVTVDDFVHHFESTWNKSHLGKKSKPTRVPRMSCSEIMTIVIFFHASGQKNFKEFYRYLWRHHRHDFPSLVSYNRLIELIPNCVVPLCGYLLSRMGQCTGISFIDSTSIKVCHNKRINRNKVFQNLAARGKTSMGWFFGFKLHLIVNDKGEILSLYISKGNTDDRVPVESLCHSLFGKLFGDKGYIGQKLFEKLFNKGIKLVTNVRSNMKKKILDEAEKILLRKRFIIETINDQLKNISQIEHTRHRSPKNFFINLISGIIAYTHQDKKPSLNIDIHNSGAVILA